MRIFASALSFAITAAVAAVAADKNEKPATVRVLTAAVPGEANGEPTEPTVIKSADELEKVIKDAVTVKAIKEAVDFNKEHVLYFSWSGSGQDKITFDLGAGDKAKEVIFQYSAGRTRDLRQHHKLFALPNDAKFKVKSDR